MREPGVYALTNTTSGEQYIGSAKDTERRCKQHMHELTRGIHPNPRLQAAFDRDGSSAFRWDVLEHCAPHRHKLFACEQRHIDALKPAYNLQPVAGSNLGYRATPETLAKQRAIAGSPEGRAIRSAANRARWANPEYRAAMLQLHMGRKRSPEARANIAAGQRRRSQNPEQRQTMIATAAQAREAKRRKQGEQTA